MTDESMPALPTRFRTLQLDYAKMLWAVQETICGTNMTPKMALVLAFVGDQTMTRTDIERYGYFIGTSAHYCLEALIDDHLIERVEGPNRRTRPVKLTPLGRRIAASIRTRLANTVPARPITDEVAA